MIALELERPPPGRKNPAPLAGGNRANFKNVSNSNQRSPASRRNQDRLSPAAIVTRLMAEVELLREENEELRVLAFGEIEYFEALAARWAKHLRPQHGRGRPCR
jgi:hypothetical protein